MLTLRAQALGEDRPLRTQVNLIPYYAWNNRGDNKTMNVWFARSAKTLMEGSVHTVGNIKNVSATHTFSNDEVTAVADG